MTPSGSALNQGKSGHLPKKDSSDLPGERIFAICLRRVRFDWCKSDDTQGPWLKKDNCWVVPLRGMDGLMLLKWFLKTRLGKNQRWSQ